MVQIGLTRCDGCEGCGYVANDYHRTPWILYTPPLTTDEGYDVSLRHTRIYCNKCKGTGRIPAWRRSLYRHKKDRR